MNRNEINKREWNNPDNWQGGFLGIYYSKEDGLDDKFCQDFRCSLTGNVNDNSHNNSAFYHCVFISKNWFGFLISAEIKTSPSQF